MTTYDEQSETSLRQALKDHWKRKYKTLRMASGFLGCTPEWLGQLSKGKGWPSDLILADAGIEVTVTRIVGWRRK